MNILRVVISQKKRLITSQEEIDIVISLEIDHSVIRHCYVGKNNEL